MIWIKMWLLPLLLCFSVFSQIALFVAKAANICNGQVFCMQFLILAQLADPKLIKMLSLSMCVCVCVCVYVDVNQIITAAHRDL